MVNQKLTDRGVSSISDSSDIIHVVKGARSYQQKMSVAVDDKIQIVSDQLAGISSGYKGFLAIADTPIEDGYYYASESGTYTNAGSLVVSLASKITIITVSDTQTTFEKLEIPIDTLGYEVVRTIGEFDTLVAAGTSGTWLILDDITLTADKTIPPDVTLHFNGGVISGAFTITGNDTKLETSLVKIFDTDITHNGTFKNKYSYVEWFGAVGDGITDDIQAINNSLAFAKISSGTVVLQKELTYRTSNTVVIPSNTTLTTKSGKAIIKALRNDLSLDMFDTIVNENYYLNPITLVANSNDITISNIIVDANCAGLTGTPTTNNVGAGVRLYNVKNAHINNIEVRNTHTAGLLFSGVYDSIIENVYLYNIGLVPYTIGVDNQLIGDGNGVSLYNGNNPVGNNVVRDCIAENFRDNGFTLYAQEENIIENCYSKGISTVSTTNSQGGFSIENTANMCIITNSMAKNVPYGVIASNYGYKSLIKGCNLTANFAGVLISKSETDVINCDITVLNGTGVVIGTEDNADYYEIGSRVINNKINGTDHTILSKGVLVRNPKNVIIKGNTIINTQKFIEVKRASGIAFTNLEESNLVIHSNLFYGDCDVVIQINELKGVNVLDNIFDGVSSNYGIYMNQETEYITIKNNRINQNTSVGIQSIYFAKATVNSIVENNPTSGWFDSSRWFKLSDGTFDAPLLIQSGTGTPENIYYAGTGSIWYRTDGGTSTSMYIKESAGTSKTGWVAK